MIDRTRYSAVTFDCYGTLIDWDTGVGAYFRDWTARTGIQAGEKDILQAFAQSQYAHQCARPFKPYRRVLADAFADVTGQFGNRSDKSDAEAFAGTVGDWPAFGDTVASLRALKSAGLHLAVLSNVDNASFVATHARLDHLVDTVVTAEMVGAYKPELTMFEALFAALAEKGISRKRLLHVAQSRFHDVAPANALGLDVVWIDRRRGSGGGIAMASDAEPMAHFDSLAAFVAAFDASL